MTFYIISCLVFCTLVLNFLPAQTQTAPEKCSEELANLVEKSLAECEGEAGAVETTEETTSESPEGETESPDERRLTPEEEKEERQKQREERQKEREERQRAREERQKAREERLNAREQRLSAREDRLKAREDRLKVREDKRRDCENQRNRPRNKRQVIDRCLADKIKIHEIGMELIRKCKEAELSPSLLDVRVLSTPDEEINTCLAKAINQC